MRTRKNKVAVLFILLVLFLGLTRMDSLATYAQIEDQTAEEETDHLPPEDAAMADEESTPQNNIEYYDGMGGYARPQYDTRTRPMTQDEADRINNVQEDYAQRYRDRRAPLIEKQIELHARMSSLLSPPEAFEETARRLSEEITNIEVETVGLEAKVVAIHKAIDRLSHEAERRISEDKVAQKLEELLEIHQKKYERASVMVHTPFQMTSDEHLEMLQEKYGWAEEAADEIARWYGRSWTDERPDLEALRSNVLEAEINLVKHIEELRDSSGLNVIPSMNQQLLETEIKLAELEAKRHVIRERLSRVQELIPLQHEYELNSQLIETISKKYTEMHGDFTPMKAGDPKTEFFDWETGELIDFGEAGGMMW